ncbi:MAG: TIGR02587 family membrane protein [Thermoanaerobaculia bacterium]
MSGTRTGDAAADESRHDPPSMSDSWREYGRGFAGGLLFSLPLLYTMEVWWTGFIAQPERLLVLLAFTFLLLLGYNRYAGLRHDATWAEVAIDSVEELGLGIVTSAGVLYLIGRIGPSTSRSEAIGKIIIEAAVVAVGFSVGSAQLGSGGRDMGKGSGEDELRQSLGSHLVIAACGAFLFASNVAPTKEILVIAVETDASRLVGLAALSLAIAAGILYFVDFRGTDRFVTGDRKRDVAMGMAMTYAVALTASALLLWFFGRFDQASAQLCARQAVVLAFPAVLGAAAGRLLLQS